MHSIEYAETLTSVRVIKMSGFIMADLEEQIQQLETSEEAVVEEAPVETEEETQAPENLAELEQKRKAINEDAEEHKRLRDDLNKQTKEWVAKRDALNAQVPLFLNCFLYLIVIAS